MTILYVFFSIGLLTWTALSKSEFTHSEAEPKPELFEPNSRGDDTWMHGGW